VHNNIPGIIEEQREWYLLERLNSVPRHLLEIVVIPPHPHPVLISAYEPILVVAMRGVAETFKTDMDKMPQRTNFKLVIMCLPKMRISTKRI
jgi:hypothetical protein